MSVDELVRMGEQRMPNRFRPYEESLQEALRDPREAAEYLNACLRDGSPEVFVLALRQVIEALGPVAADEH